MSATVRIDLPRLVGSRDDANTILAHLPLNDATLVVNCRELLSASPSFADQLVHRALLEMGAQRLSLVGARERFADYVIDSAKTLGVGDRVEVQTSGEMPLTTG